MVGFRNRYMVMEVFLDPNKDFMGNDPIIITQFNLSKSIKDSILANFGECGLASSLNSFQGMGLGLMSSIFTYVMTIELESIAPCLLVCYLKLRV